MAYQQPYDQNQQYQGYAQPPGQDQYNQPQAQGYPGPAQQPYQSQGGYYGEYGAQAPQPPAPGQPPVQGGYPTGAGYGAPPPPSQTPQQYPGAGYAAQPSQSQPGYPPQQPPGPGAYAPPPPQQTPAAPGYGAPRPPSATPQAPYVPQYGNPPAAPPPGVGAHTVLPGVAASGQPGRKQAYNGDLTPVDSKGYLKGFKCFEKTYPDGMIQRLVYLDRNDPSCLAHAFPQQFLDAYKVKEIWTRLPSEQKFHLKGYRARLEVGRGNLESLPLQVYDPARLKVFDPAENPTDWAIDLLSNNRSCPWSEIYGAIESSEFYYRFEKDFNIEHVSLKCKTPGMEHIQLKLLSFYRKPSEIAATVLAQKTRETKPHSRKRRHRRHEPNDDEFTPMQQIFQVGAGLILSNLANRTRR